MTRHPAKFSDAILRKINEILTAERDGRRWRVLDPFAGVGRVHELALPGEVDTLGIEIEREWADMHPGNVWGDARHAWSLIRARARWEHVDALITSPCLAPHERILTADLRWVPSGDIRAGDRIVAFDEMSPFLKANGHSGRRKWRFAEVLQSHETRKECVRVILESEKSIVCSTDHPWLALPYSYGGYAARWVEAGHLMSLHDPHVMRQLDVWSPNRSYEAGWLAGMLDGEGSLSLGVHGTPKLQLSQAIGPLSDLAEKHLRQFGFSVNTIRRPDIPNRRPMLNIYVNGGMPGILRALGTLRPSRLLDKWTSFDLSSRTVQPAPERVVAVEPIGTHPIQAITTTSKTYIGEGYLMHNTYGNRMADCHEARDASRRNTYRHALGRPLSAGSTSGLQWGPEYRALHEAVYEHVVPLLAPHGVFILNMSDHIRNFEPKPVTKWHVEALEWVGLEEVERHRVETSRNRFGENHGARVPYESVILFRRRES